MSITFGPAIKWSGSKRHQASAILAHIPQEFGTYYEPFVGGGSVMYALSPEKGVAGDICVPLIGFWNTLKADPAFLTESYRRDWEKLQEEGPDYYYKIRDRFNAEKKPEDLLFLSRTSFNGLIRFNDKGDFNAPFHHKRKGITPDKLGEVLTSWSQRIQGMSFTVDDFRNLLSTAKEGDLVYLDPPYFNTKGMFYSKLNYKDLLDCLDELNRKGVKFILSYDGKQGDRDKTVDIPKELYKRHEFLYSGNSSFSRLRAKQNRVVYESLYMNW